MLDKPSLSSSSLHRRTPVSTVEVGPDFRRKGGEDSKTSRSGKYFRLLAAAFTAALLTTATDATADQSDMIKESVAVLQGLNKITARVSEIVVPVGKTAQFGTLQITVRDCEKNQPVDRPEDAAFLQIDEVRPGEENVRRFSGWMFAQSPALSSLEHPVYDVILLDCKGAPADASGSPPASPSAPADNSSGNDAR